MASSAKKKMTKDSLSVEEATQLVNEQAFQQYMNNMPLEDSTSSIDSLKIHKENKATILKMAGSTRRNLPNLNFKDLPQIMTDREKAKFDI